MVRKCIYCGKSENLSESDIIPDALTNARILNKNVCRVEHNNKFSDMFESEVIQKLALVTNNLDIKSSKSRNYHKYDASVILNGEKYVAKKIGSDTELFKGRKLKSEDGKHLLGPLENTQIRSTLEHEVKIVDINQLEIEIKIELDINVYFSLAMFRMVAKIAYEWYCLKNEINDTYSEFDEIIKFVTTGKGNSVVSIVAESGVYDFAKGNNEYGSHFLILYVDKYGGVNVIVNLFGIVLYRVKISKVIPEINKYTCVYQELLIDGTRNEVKYGSFRELDKSLSRSFIEVSGGEITYMLPVDMQDFLLVKKLFLYHISEYIANGVLEYISPNEELVELIVNNLNNLLKESLLHKKSIKRFVKEHIISFDREIQLNPNGTDRKGIFMFYILYLIGKGKCESIDINKINELVNREVKEKFKNQYVINDEVCETLKKIMMKDKDYSTYILKGAKVVNEW
ncbi:hypothetical protein BBG47_27055 [Paenibacillus sp. KS1]|uniref:hypothetical protein n=1 Tax=Paenibacillus sp. KS1 TaxID=1849249 RepID=UPI0008065AEC|nr:hypothetical protein [Paenibacillus sp. KS1]OBY76451.1 hypothetical protein BBG47_27055 [Paenibacillus sp. KS1]